MSENNKSPTFVIKPAFEKNGQYTDIIKNDNGEVDVSEPTLCRSGIVYATHDYKIKVDIEADIGDDLQLKNCMQSITLLYGNNNNNIKTVMFEMFNEEEDECDDILTDMFVEDIPKGGSSNPVELPYFSGQSPVNRSHSTTSHKNPKLSKKSTSQKRKTAIRYE